MVTISVEIDRAFVFVFFFVDCLPLIPQCPCFYFVCATAARIFFVGHSLGYVLPSATLPFSSRDCFGVNFENLKHSSNKESSRSLGMLSWPTSIKSNKAFSFGFQLLSDTHRKTSSRNNGCTTKKFIL